MFFFLITNTCHISFYVFTAGCTKGEVSSILFFHDMQLTSVTSLSTNHLYIIVGMWKEKNKNARDDESDVLRRIEKGKKKKKKKINKIPH